ncbi:MAG: glycosyltransferase family 2 protein [Kastovskya adunca ATA6-11-RM4]|jgi:glycosyltransferase involved in cell wall biosynthesis|nr:glycosyltransferase family 2 protein [Kastovskya adunca ATA6-11-RM4]
MLFPKKPTISVIIPVYNGGTAFRECLSKLMEAQPQPDEVIVVADGDTDDSWQLAKEFGVKVLRLSVCSGPARARNVGAQAARGDILFFVDADVAICPEAIEQVAIAFSQQPDLDALIGSYDDAPGAKNFLSQYRNLFHHYTHQIASTKASTFWGACGAIRRDVFLRMGGFDERYRQPSVEDIELGYRLCRAGYKIQLHKGLQVKHLKRWEAISLIKTDFFKRALPWTELIWRDRLLNNDLNLRTENRISTVLVYGLMMCLIAAGWSVAFLAVATGLALLLLALNAPLYRFFQSCRGKRFALRTIPWHWLYYLYSGLAFATGTVRHFQKRRVLAVQFSEVLEVRSDITTALELR